MFAVVSARADGQQPDASGSGLVGLHLLCMVNKLLFTVSPDELRMAGRVGADVNRHLNVFTPYQLAATHEDQLTRAAMIVLRAVPLARDAFLAQLNCRRSGDLPEPEFDMQTGDVVTPPGDVDEATTLAELVSVFLSPDVDRDLSGVALSEREAEQRLDGVVRFGDELVVVIESKIVGKAPSQQASELRLRGAQVTHSRVKPLGWHDLLQSWWRLLERGLLAPAERLLIEDLVGFAEEHFPHLLPFSTLTEAGNHPLRRQRRLMALLRNAIGIEEIRPRTTGGAEAMVDAALGTRCVQRLMLDCDGDELVLATAAGELKPQALAFYGSGGASRVVALAEREGWAATPSLYLGYRGAHTQAQRLYPTCGLSLDEYVRRWAEEDRERIGAYQHDKVRTELWPWLHDRGYASEEDTVHLDEFLDGLGRRDAHLRPRVEITRRWAWVDAERLDDRGTLTDDLRTAITELLSTLDEPPLPAQEHGRTAPSM